MLWGTMYHERFKKMQAWRVLLRKGMRVYHFKNQSLGKSLGAQTGVLEIREDTTVGYRLG